MLELKFSRRKIDLELYGEKFSVNFPTAQEINQYAKDYENVSKEAGAEFDLSLVLLEKLGLPKEKAQSMEIGHIEQLLDMLLKKNS